MYSGYPCPVLIKGDVSIHSVSDACPYGARGSTVHVVQLHFVMRLHESVLASYMLNYS